MSGFPQQTSFSGRRRSLVGTRGRPKPLSNQDALDLIAFINANDPRYTARMMNTRHADYPYRADCFRRDTGGHALFYHSVEDYGADARRQVEDAAFQAALIQWIAERG